MINNNKKIAVILPNLENGGAERSHIYIANEWLSLNYDVTFILMNKKGTLLNNLNKNIKIIDIKKDRLRSIVLPLSIIFLKNKFDVILAPMWPITVISTISWILSFASSKLYLVDHNPMIKEWAQGFKINWLLVRISIKITYKLVNGVICVSKGIENNIRNIVSLKKNKLKVIYNPVTNDPNKYEKNIQLRENLFGNSKYCIVSIGSLKKSKDYITLIKAADILKSKKLDFKLLIIGDGEEKESLNNLIETLQLESNVNLLGHVNDPFPYLLNSDLYVNSSIYDGMPLSLIEALISGTKIVSTDCESGPREILKNGELGKLVPIKNYNKIAAEIENVLLEKSKIQIRDNKEILNYDVKKISKEYINFFNL